MSDNVIQTSFAAGELAPSLYAHVDLQKYKSGAAIMRNFFVDYRSGASTRPGTKFVIQAYDSSKPVRLVGYQFSTTVSFIIEFGDFYCRFITGGESVLEADVNITAITKAFPAAVTAAANTLSAGDWVFIEGVAGMIEINSRFYQVLTAGATFTLGDVNGVPIDSRDYTTYTSGGTVARVYKIASPYAAADLADLKFVQSAQQMTITHPDYAPRTLIATTPISWAFATITFTSSATAPTGLAGVASSGTGSYYSYKISSVDTNGQESTPSAAAAVDNVLNLTTTAGSITLTWNAATNADYYRLYKAIFRVGAAVPADTAYGFIGFADGLSFVDSNVESDFSVTPQIADNPFTGNNPITFSYFQQRACYAGSDDSPTGFWMSQPGQFNNFNYSNPTQEDDAITGTIVSLQVNAIQSLVPMPGGLIAFTTKGAWQLSGGSGGAGGDVAVTPINIIATPQDGSGSNAIQPIVIVEDIVYIQAKGSVIRNLTYKLDNNIYRGADISVLSNHLFYGHQITEWAYAEEPFKIIWAIRTDGVLLSLTYVKEQEIYGWARHDTLGLFKSVASVTETTRDATYVVVERLISGAWVKMIERFDDRQFTYGNYNPSEAPGLPNPMIWGNAESAWCVDCGIQSTLTEPAAGLTASSNYGAVTFQADAAVFASTNIGDVIRMGGGIATISGFTSPTIVTGTWTVSPSKTIPNDPDMTPIPAVSGRWSMTTPFDTFYGLDYLEGETVSILADGGVVTPQVVTDGRITLASEASLVTVGLAFIAQLQTMYLDVKGTEGTVQGKRKKISALTVRALNSRGLKAGNTFITLTDIKELNPATILGTPMPLITADERVIMDPSWNIEGQICLQQSDPLPATILGVIPEIVVGDT